LSSQENQQLIGLGNLLCWAKSFPNYIAVTVMMWEEIQQGRAKLYWLLYLINTLFSTHFLNISRNNLLYKRRNEKYFLFFPAGILMLLLIVITQ
jgi:hypothetical protein